MYCELCGMVVNDAQYCFSCLYKIENTIGYLDFCKWVMSQEFDFDTEAILYDKRTSYHTCIRCGEMLMGVERSVHHWESKHMPTLYPNGLPFDVVAV